LLLFKAENHWRTRGGGDVSANPKLNLHDFFNCVFAKHTVQIEILLLYSLYPNVFTGKR